MQYEIHVREIDGVVWYDVFAMFDGFQLFMARAESLEGAERAIQRLRGPSATMLAVCGVLFGCFVVAALVVLL